MKDLRHQVERHSLGAACFTENTTYHVNTLQPLFLDCVLNLIKMRFPLLDTPCRIVLPYKTKDLPV
nr:hypothetical protein [Candidatus Sigynarchaeota archaeon]